ncbi:hypothetical protein M9H77_11628 [Catharanthus roseus]|uniref:Uncharacterized protein n=1 Tax=Catharanthus roseus TaxID=4058 RepID=A0ACC0BF40_CATRO|nr:hypothetical protein M9H77_11628 [Catharanthus roseus]
MNTIYVDLQNKFSDVQYICNRETLAPINDIVDNVNSYILSLLLGLCNGTRLIIKRLGESVIEAEEITGIHTGVTHYIDRIGMSPRKFPIKVCFVMTINKSQCQTFENVGVYLRKVVFCHGQLYVAASRVTSRNGLKFYLDNNRKCKDNMVKKNVVYSEIFSNIHEVLIYMVEYSVFGT